MPRSARYCNQVNREIDEARAWNRLDPSEQYARLLKASERDINAECSVCGNEFASHRPYSSTRSQRPRLACPPERD
jgi:hypothetical protein